MPRRKLKVTVQGKPITKSNALKARWKRRRAEFYVDQVYVDYEEKIRSAAQRVMDADSKAETFSKGPVKIELIYYLGSNRRKDLLNLPKTTCDALNGVFYDDDSQIVEAIASKRYDKENPRVEITVSRPSRWRELLKEKFWSLPLIYSKMEKK